MKKLFAAFVVLLALGCRIAPVISTPMDSPGARYRDCTRAAEDYCEESIKARAKDMDACVAEHRFQCLSSGSLPGSTARS